MLDRIPQHWLRGRGPAWSPGSFRMAPFPPGPFPMGSRDWQVTWGGKVGHLAGAEGCGGKHRALAVRPGASYCSSLSLSFPMCANRLTAPSSEELLWRSERRCIEELEHISNSPAMTLGRFPVSSSLSFLTEEIRTSPFMMGKCDIYRQVCKSLQARDCKSVTPIRGEDVNSRCVSEKTKAHPGAEP